MSDTVEAHPEPELRRIEAGTAPPSDFEAVARHLVRGCTPCGERLAEFWNPATLDIHSLGEAIDRVRTSLKTSIRLRTKGRIEADALIRRLRDEPQSRRYLLLRNLERARRDTVCERLVDEVLLNRHEDVGEALQFAELLVLVSTRLGLDGEELRARALIERGNVRRILSQFAGAKADFSAAERLLKVHGSDPLVSAILLSCQSSLARAAQRHDEALRLSLKAVKIYSRYGDIDGLAKELVKLGMLQAYSGNPELGIEPTLKALRIVDPSNREVRIYGLTQLAHLLSETGDHPGALELTQTIRPLVEAHAPSLILARFDWNAGRIARNFQDLDAAQEIFARLQAFFSRKALFYDAALLSLELALVHAKRGERSRLRSSISKATALGKHLGLDTRQLVIGHLLPHANESETIELRRALNIA